jgi:hypothetical protein
MPCLGERSYLELQHRLKDYDHWRVLSESCGEHCAGRATANDDHITFELLTSASVFSLLLTTLFGAG